MAKWADGPFIIKENSQIICEGWVAALYTRDLDLDKNPITDWKFKSARSAWGKTVNPYVYTGPGRAVPNDYHNRNQVYKRFEPNPHTFPDYKLYLSDKEEYDRQVEVFHEFNRTRKLLGYAEQKVVAKPAKIVMEK